MFEWWTSLEGILKIFWGITLSASLVFVVQSIMTFLGADADFDIDASGLDADSSGMMGADMGLLTFRNFVNFFMGFGWTSVLLYDKVESLVALLVIAVIVGVALVAAVMMLFKWLSTMQQSGNIDVFKSAVGCKGKVYLTIPAGRGAEGKVQIAINNSIREYSALTDGPSLKTGTAVRVLEVVDSATLLVEEIKSVNN